MRCGRPLALCAFIALSLFNEIVASRGIVLRRQDDGIATTTQENVSPTSSTAISEKLTEATNINNVPNTTNAKSAATGASASQETRTTTTSVSTSAAPTIVGSDDGLTVSSEDAVYSGGLPIEPKVTPGVAIAGVILIIAGVPFCLVGIKIKVLQVFLSTFFLSGLGVTVLIIYVMNPPVSNAIQGAYVTAVTITGILTGCLAVVFPEVTEALGCLLGGFCVSMWFLVLKPGGLVTSIYGKLIVIAAFCFVTSSMAFHKITRPYSLIFSISFSGATATVLGIDCFSRAGLKEFWIYIWGLNDNVFPLETNNYPHTRGVRVEIAVIILITAFGIMSQVKLWKILKERRATKDIERRRQVADLEALDENVGRRVEEGQKEERARWEMAYGGKVVHETVEETTIEETTVVERPNTGEAGRADSGIGDEDYRKRSGEDVEEFVETEEMRRGREEHMQEVSREQSFDAAGQQPSTQDGQVNRIAVPVGIDEIEEIDPSKAVAKEGGSLAPGSASRCQSTHSSRRKSSQSERLSSQSLVPPEAVLENPNVTPTPEVIPLPIPISVETDDDDEVSSLATWAGSDRIMPGDLDMEVVTTPMLVRSEDDDDKASSVAATYDGEDDTLETMNDLPAINEETERSTSPLSPINTDDEITPTGTSFKISVDEILEVARENISGVEEMTFVSESGKGSTRSSFDKDVFTVNHSKANTTHQTTPAATSPPSIVDTPSLKTTRFPENLAPASSPKTKLVAPLTVGADFGPQFRPSPRVVKNYRTNEWAKHLADADKPELDKLEEPTQVVDTIAEVSAPVYVKELQETSDKPSQPSTRSASRVSLYEPVNSTLRPSNSFSIQNPAIRPVMRTSSVPIIPQEDRQDSTSPIERCFSPNSSGKNTPSPLPQNTLIGKRESIVRNRQTYGTHLEHGPPSPSGTSDLRCQSPNTGVTFHPSLNVPGNSRSPTPGLYPSQHEASQYRASMLDDDMSLANRRNELVHRSVSQNTLSGPFQRRSFTPQPQQPDKREAMLKYWRESIKSDLQTNGHTVNQIHERRGDLTERQQLVLTEKLKNMKENLKDEVIDERMRQKDMLELHKEALRKMQAGANKHI